MDAYAARILREIQRFSRLGIADAQTVAEVIELERWRRLPEVTRDDGSAIRMVLDLQRPRGLAALRLRLGALLSQTWIVVRVAK